jgi:glycosyltransferase involved in cell wall biosynthesis
MPKVAVVTSVYNGEDFLEQCVHSILDQTFRDFEFIILNNGSTDETAQILNQFKDSRLRIIHQENLGVTRSLDKGVRMARADLIARLDADDYSFPNRLRRQVNFMDKNLDYALCGSKFLELTGNKISPQKVPFVENDKNIRRILSCYNPFAHSAVIFRKQSFIDAGGYDDRFTFSVDYDLWVRMLQTGKGYILEDELTVMRLSAESMSFQNRRRQKLESLALRWRAFKNFGGNPVKVTLLFLKTILGLIFPLGICLQRALARNNNYNSPIQ